MGVKHFTVEIVRDIGECVKDACFVRDGVWFDVDIVKVLFLQL